MSASLAGRGYAMPPEWARHAATWIAWPHEVRDWPGRFAPIPWAYGELTRLISRHELVRILVNHAAHESKARAVLRKVGVDLSRVDFHRVPTDRVWTRDSGALIVANARGHRIATHWRFNGWAKYENHKRDDAVAGRMAKALGLDEHEVRAGSRDVVLEGGAIDVDGAGALLATEACSRRCRPGTPASGVSAPRRSWPKISASAG